MWQLNEITKQSLQQQAQQRPADIYKSIAGKVLLLTGSFEYPGAALLSLAAARKSGVGYACLNVARDLIPAFAARYPGALYQPRVSADSAEFSGTLSSLLSNYDAVLIGCGRGINSTTMQELKFLLMHANNLIIDADALRLLAELQAQGELAPLLATRQRLNLATPVILPHYGELKSLYQVLASAGCSLTAADYALLSQIEDEAARRRLTAALLVQKAYQVNIVVKGIPTYCLVDNQCWYNTDACNALAKAGSGDVLAGLLAGLLAQGFSAASAMATAVYVHCRAAIVLSERSASTRTVMPEDLPAAFAAVFASIGLAC